MKNRAIEFYRYIFACIIFLLHFAKYTDWESATGHFNGGYLAVDFFFILSGFLIMQGIDRKSQGEVAVLFEGTEKETAGFILGKYKRLFPPYLIAIALVFIIGLLTNEYRHPFNTIFKVIPEILGIQIFIRTGTICGYTWYISGLIWAGALVYYLIRKHRDMATHILFPFIFLAFLGWSQKTIGHVDVVAGNDIFYAAFFRAFSEIGMGATVFCLSNRLKGSIEKIPSALVGIVELLIFAFILFVMWNYRHDHMDYICIFAGIALITITFTGHGLWTKILDNPFSAFIGGLSFYVYIFQGVFQAIGFKFFPDRNYWVLAGLLIVALTVFSFLFKLIEKSIFHNR